MQTVTATELARRLREILDGVEFRGDALTIVRNKREIAQLLPGPQQMRAKQTFFDLYGIVGEEAAAGWRKDGDVVESIEEGIRDPWDI